MWLGDFNPEFLYYIDWEMWIRHLSIGDCYIIPETLSYFRVHDKQVSKMVTKNMLQYCESYYFYKRVRKMKSAMIDFAEIDIDGLVKEKAANCIRGIIKLIPRLHKKEGRILFNKVLKIVYKEKVPLSLYVKALNQSSIFKKVSYSV